MVCGMGYPCDPLTRSHPGTIGDMPALCATLAVALGTTVAWLKFGLARPLSPLEILKPCTSAGGFGSGDTPLFPRFGDATQTGECTGDCVLTPTEERCPRTGGNARGPTGTAGVADRANGDPVGAQRTLLVGDAYAGWGGCDASR